MKKLIHFSYNHPKIIVTLVLLTVIAAVTQFPKIVVDTDPENMLPKDEFVRIFHDEVKKEFAIYDFIVLGVINGQHPQGVFNVETLNKVYEITEKIKQIDGVISREIIAFSTKDNIRQGALGEVVFEWLMKNPIATEEEALTIRDEAVDNPLFNGTIVSEDGKALCVYIPIKQKNISHTISQELLKIIKGLEGSEQYHITGLPVAEDTFGIEMFKQMAVSAPLAGLIIFILMWIFFKNVKLIISPMLLAIATVLITMGLLMGLGFPVHIMSSMIPIFLMPIAVLDSVHILSEFFDKYRHIGKKDETVFRVLDELFTPMLFTSLTSAVGFFSLSFSPIPPVQTFGVFVAIGVMAAWFLTMTFIPAYIALMGERSLKNLMVAKNENINHHRLIDTSLSAIKKFSLKNAKFIVFSSIVLIILSGYGISKIKVNDNPVRWFTKNHRIRVADRVLNDHFAGTYTAYLVLEASEKQRQIFAEPAMLNYIDSLQNHLLKTGDVGKTTALTDVVKKVYYELLGGDREHYLIPQSKRAVLQTLISYENSHKPDDLWHMVTPDYSKVNIWLQSKSGDNKDMSRIVAEVDKYIKENKPPFAVKHNWAGLTYINVIWQNKMVTGMLKNFFGSFLIVFFMMTFLFRSPLRGLISMIPLTITIIFIYSLLGFAGKDYDMPVAVLSALTLGLSIDFAIHFMQRAREIFVEKKNWLKISETLFQGPARAISRNALVVAIGFLPLLVAPLMPYRTVGFFMFAIMFISSFATLIILPAIITLFPKSVFENEPVKIICKCKYCFLISIGCSVAIVYILRGYTFLGWKPTHIAAIAVVAVMGGICSQISKRSFRVSDKEDH
jgi:uncharacterized protein